jgi:hypothetical protein
MPKIRWAPPLRPALLKRLYDSDAAGFQDTELCDEVGIALFARCSTFARVRDGEVDCPICVTVFPVTKDGRTRCPNENCDWSTTWPIYSQSLRNYNARTGRAVAAYDDFLRAYPGAKTYKQKILLIDRLIHSFHVNEKTGQPVKSIASKLLEGNKKAVVKFLDDLSAIHPGDKERWRRDMEMTIDRRIVQRDEIEKG